MTSHARPSARPSVCSCSGRNVNMRTFRRPTCTDVKTRRDSRMRLKLHTAFACSVSLRIPCSERNDEELHSCGCFASRVPLQSRIHVTWHAHLSMLAPRMLTAVRPSCREHCDQTRSVHKFTAHPASGHNQHLAETLPLGADAQRQVRHESAGVAPELEADEVH